MNVALPMVSDSEKSLPAGGGGEALRLPSREAPEEAPEGPRAAPPPPRGEGYSRVFFISSSAMSDPTTTCGYTIAQK